MDSLQSKLVGVHLPIELVTDALREHHINQDEIAKIIGDHGLFYMVSGKPVSAAGRVEYLPDGTGVIGYYLNHKENPLSLDKAKQKVELMLIGGGMREKLYTCIRVILNNGRELKPLYVFTAVAELKGLD